VKRTRFKDWPCPLARTVDLIGDWWTPLILREAYYGVRRFDDFEANLKIGRNVLAERLKRLVDEGMFEKHLYEAHPPRFEYLLTKKSRDFFPVIAAIMRWGNEWMFDDGPTIELVESASGRPLEPLVVDERTMKPISLRGVETRLGPGFPPKLRKAALATGRYGPPDNQKQVHKPRS
jgi:DNA-binding HxlR family transcriptional regulator